MTRKDYTVALNGTGSGVDDPDQQFYENYACGSDRNYSGYCNPELDKDSTGNRPNPIRKSARNWCGRSTASLQEDGARPIISHNRAATCWQPQVKGLTIDGQQHLQRLALRRRLARQIAATFPQLGSVGQQ